MLTLAERTRRKTSRRILPFVFLLYIVAYLDRANVAFAKTTMSAALGFSEAVFGFGTGIFFAGYLLLEIPSAIVVEKWSARRWLARILISWGFCTVLVGLVRTPGEFYTARFILGAAEAGFFPGVIVYLTHWFVATDRARAMAGFIMAIPVALAVGGPLSALILKLAGWRGVFILEGLPAIVLGFVTLRYLTDHPREAKWLEPDERAWLSNELDRERRRKRAASPASAWRALVDRNVLLLAFTLLLANIGAYAFVLWLPQTLEKVWGVSGAGASALSIVPFGGAVLTVWVSGRVSDRWRRRKTQVSLLSLLTALFFALSVVPGQPPWMVLAWLCTTAAVVFAWPPPFWVLPTLSLGEVAAAASIGLINSIGNFGGFVGPSVVGYLLSRRYSFAFTVVLLSLSFALAGTLVLFVRERHDSAILPCGAQDENPTDGTAGTDVTVAGT